MMMMQKELEKQIVAVGKTLVANAHNLAVDGRILDFKIWVLFTSDEAPSIDVSYTLAVSNDDQTKQEQEHLQTTIKEK